MVSFFRSSSACIAVNCKRAGASECLLPVMSQIAEEIKSVMNNNDLNLFLVFPSQLIGSGTTG